MEETFGQRLQRLRQRAGYSQPQLASRADVPVGTIRGWEQGRRVPNLDVAARLAKALGVSLDELAGLTPSVINGAAPASDTATVEEAETAPQQVEADAGKAKKMRKRKQG